MKRLFNNKVASIILKVTSISFIAISMILMVIFTYKRDRYFSIQKDYFQSLIFFSLMLVILMLKFLNKKMEIGIVAISFIIVIILSIKSINNISVYIDILSDESSDNLANFYFFSILPFLLLNVSAFIIVIYALLIVCYQKRTTYGAFGYLRD
ncbi:MAG: hypothetical protein RBQ97_07200 [Acholeplasma sp.]|nr:hypothetical protein [Acholeplasma sp.]